MEDRQLEALRAVVDYLWPGEQDDWIAEGRPEDHLFHDLMILDSYVKGHDHG